MADLREGVKMSNFDIHQDSYDSSERPLGEIRFPDGVWGVFEWRDALRKLDELAESEDIQPIETRDPTPHLLRPRVFVSHQRKDAFLARRIAWVASRYGFSHWLDVLDPNLARLHGRKLDSRRKAILMAQIIETALLNCTHVVVVLTTNAKASRWIPYEYGRVKERAVATHLALSWIAPDYFGYLPEYLMLGAQTHNEKGLRSWFVKQRRWFLNRNKLPGLPRRSKKAWIGRVPKKLP